MFYKKYGFNVFQIKNVLLIFTTEWEYRKYNGLLQLTKNKNGKLFSIGKYGIGFGKAGVLKIDNSK